MLWLYLLGITTVLSIAVRRLWRRQKPLSDEVYFKTIAIEHVHDGVAWVGVDGRINYTNPSLAGMLDLAPEKLLHRSWFEMFTPQERRRVEQAYSQMLLAGLTTFEVDMIDSNATITRRGILLVAGHDHKTRLAGHHCIVRDRLLERETDERLMYARRG